MKVKKYSIIIAFIIIVLSSGMSIYLEFFSELLPLWLIDHKSYFTNVSFSIFGSALILFVISIVEYINIKKKVLEEFYQEVAILMRLYRRLRPVSNNSNSIEILGITEKYVEVNKYSLRILGNLYSEIDFIFGNRRIRNRLYNNLYLEFVEMNKKISVLHFHSQLGEADERILGTMIGDLQHEIFKGKFKDIDESNFFHNIYNEFHDRLNFEMNFLFTLISKESKNIEREEPEPIVSSLLVKRQLS